MNKTIIKIKGMVCEGCENRVENALKEVEGVEKVEADYKTGIVKILANEKLERRVMEDTISDIGFEVVKEN